MITSSGVLCDVCNSFILPGLSNSINPFNVTAFEDTLHCHDQCKPSVEKAMKERDWRQLPEGRLRAAYELAEAELAKGGDDD